MRGMAVKAVFVGSLLVKPESIHLVALGAVSMLLLNVRIVTYVTFRVGVSAIRKGHIDGLNVVTF